MRRLVRSSIRQLRRAFRPNASALADLGSIVDREWYLAENADVASANDDPVIHFVRHGAREGRPPNRFFDAEWYRAVYRDSEGTLPILHYARIGRAEYRDPGPAFSAREYLATYPDVAANGIEPLEHYIRYGQAEGRITVRSILAGQGPTSTTSRTGGRSVIVLPGESGLFVPDETLARIYETFARRGGTPPG